MTVLQQILEWSKDRPEWQRDALRRLVVNGDLTEEDLDSLTEICKGKYGLSENTKGNPLSEEHVPQRGAAALAVTLNSIFHDKGVNALAENQQLNFSPNLTIVYGDNGAGKTGYIRILKLACRARGQEDILGNIVSGVAPPPPTVNIEYKVGAEEVRQWHGGATDEYISRVSVFDSQCAAVYLNERTDVAFLPFGLDLFDKLVRACRAVRTKLEIQQRALSTSSISRIAEQIPAGTAASKLIGNINSLTKIESVKALTELTVEEQRRIEFLDKALQDLQTNDPKKLLAQLSLRADQIQALEVHLRNVESILSDSEINKIFNTRAEGKRKAEEAKRLRAATFPDDLLHGTGGDFWKAMWDSAQIFSEELAYLDRDFPFTEDGAKCVLCQQNLDHAAVHRLSQFESFVQSTTESELRILREQFSHLKDILITFKIITEAINGTLNELNVDYTEKVEKIRHSLEENERRRIEIIAALGEDRGLSDQCPVLTSSFESLQAIQLEIEARIKALKESQGEDVREKMTSEVKELRARVMLAKHEAEILLEIENKKKIAAYSQCIDETKPNAITQKSSAVTKAIVSEGLKRSFKEELGRLTFRHVEVELKEVGGADGVFYHKLILTRNPGIDVPKVVSEGEQRCISIAAFFAELSTAEDPSAIVFDDPVSSLDFQWRGAVARRLVEESERRQVIVFTHDVVFLLALKQFADQNKVVQLDQHIRRQAIGAGVCVEELPWVAMSVKGKIGFLKNGWQAADRLSRTGNFDAYEKEAAQLYGYLREAWERALEEVLLGGVVERFRPSIETKKLMPLIDITEDDCEAVNVAMSKCSSWLTGHDQAAAARAPVPGSDELKQDIEQLENWVKSIRDRRK